MRVAIVAEYYPRAADPVLGIWAHRQALAARDAGADVRVLVLHRPVPPRSVYAKGPGPFAYSLAAGLRQPLKATLDGIEVRYVPFLAPPRPRSYGSWGAYAAPSLAVALRRLRRRFAYDLVHAHYAAPGADAVRRARPGTPYIASVHGGDLLSVAREWPAPVRRGLAGARLVLANSSAMADLARTHGAQEARVVHLGTDVPAKPPGHVAGRLVTVANLVARKRHADVLRALWLLRDSHPDLRWIIAGDGPERPAIERLAAELGIADRVELRGALPHAEAVALAQSAVAFVLPSVDEAFGVAYVEAMAGGVPAIGAAGEPGPQEIARCGPGGMSLVAPGDPERLARTLADLLADERERGRQGELARRTVAEHFTWDGCGRATVAAYEDALR